MSHLRTSETALRKLLGTMRQWQTEWKAVVKKDVPNRVISWEREPGSTIGNAGVVRFDSENGGTRIHPRMSYNAVGRVISHSLASLIGADPNARSTRTWSG